MNGLRQKTGRLCPTVVLVCLCLTVPGRTYAQPPLESLEPEMELLEFLGSFEDKDAGWIDPFELEAMGTDNATREEGGDAK